MAPVLIEGKKALPAVCGEPRQTCRHFSLVIYFRSNCFRAFQTASVKAEEENFLHAIKSLGNRAFRDEANFPLPIQLDQTLILCCFTRIMSRLTHQQLILIQK